HRIQDSRNMDGRFAADPLDVSRAALAPPLDRIGKKRGRQLGALARIERAGLRNAERATQVAARQVKQVRRHELDFFAVLDSVPVDSRLAARFARSALAGLPVDAASMLAQRARA